ncbi:MAG TPA: hypothetical protein VID47_14045 [Actinomycetota bacterium]|jgi:hypothetical protein
MSAQAPALRIPGKSTNHRAEWYALAVFVLVAALTVVLVFTTTSTSTTTTTSNPATAPMKVHPGFHHLIESVSGDGLRVGGTSVYRYHLLPPTNFSAGEAADQPDNVQVGGSGSERFHPLP